MELDSVRAFVRVAELASFTRAGQHLGLSKARVSALVSELEATVGTRLLQRSTRAVRLTPSGERFLARARPLVAEADDLAGMFQASRAARGVVRVDLPLALARSIYIPRVPDFLAAHPSIELALSTTDRRVDVVREGFDCVLRIGKLRDSRLVARRLGSLPTANVASPAYLAKHGMPRTLDDLARHYVVHYSLDFGTDQPSFEYVREGSVHEVPMASLLTVNATDAYAAAAIAGLGIIQAPRYAMAPSLASGVLVELLPDYPAAPLPVSLVHAYTRNVPRHVRVVLTWLAELMAPLLAP